MKKETNKKTNRRGLLWLALSGVATAVGGSFLASREDSAIPLKEQVTPEQLREVEYALMEKSEHGKRILDLIAYGKQLQEKGTLQIKNDVLKPGTQVLYRRQDNTIFLSFPGIEARIKALRHGKPTEPLMMCSGYLFALQDLHSPLQPLEELAVQEKVMPVPQKPIFSSSFADFKPSDRFLERYRDRFMAAAGPYQPLNDNIRLKIEKHFRDRWKTFMKTQREAGTIYELQSLVTQIYFKKPSDLAAHSKRLTFPTNQETMVQLIECIEDLYIILENHQEVARFVGTYGVSTDQFLRAVDQEKKNYTVDFAEARKQRREEVRAFIDANKKSLLKANLPKSLEYALRH